jgi:hypothetical protein
VKVAGEVIGGQGWYPDPFNPRPIRDKLEHVARTFSLDSVYRWVAGKPKRGDTTGEQLVNDLMALGFYNSDPGESAYYDTVKRVMDYQEKQGKEMPAVIPTDKANALYYYKQGLRYGDLKAAEKYLRLYYELGGTEKGMVQSVKRTHPLGGLAEKDWRPFLATLSPEEMESFRLALKWYNDTYLSTPAAQVKGSARRPENSESGIEKPNSESGRLTVKDAVRLMQ